MGRRFSVEALRSSRASYDRSRSCGLGFSIQSQSSRESSYRAPFRLPLEWLRIDHFLHRRSGQVLAKRGDRPCCSSKPVRSPYASVFRSLHSLPTPAWLTVDLGVKQTGTRCRCCTCSQGCSRCGPPLGSTPQGCSNRHRESRGSSPN